MNNSESHATVQSSPTSSHASPSQTVVDVTTSHGTNDASKLEAGIAAVGMHDNQAAKNEADLATRDTENKMSQGRKWFLLLVFSVAQVSHAPRRGARAHQGST